MANSIKYEITDETKLFNDTVLHRIRAVKEIPGIVLAGEDGGWIEYPHNLSQEGNCWIAPNAVVMGAAQVVDDAFIDDNAVIQNNAVILSDAVVCDNAVVKDYSLVYGLVCDNAVISGSSAIEETATIRGNAQVINSSIEDGGVVVGGNAKVSSSYIYDYNIIRGNTIIEDSTINGGLKISGNSVVKDSIIKGSHNTIENAAIRKSADILNISYAAEEDFIELTIYRNSDDDIIVAKSIGGTNTSTKLEDADLGDLTIFVYNYFQIELPNFSSDSTTSSDTSDSSTTDTENTESTSDEP